jgi:type II secretory pathway predicted ATPase ExeA
MPRNPLLPLPWHAGARLLLDEVRKGRESAFVVGPKGLGKSEYFRAETEQLAGEPRRPVYALLGEARTGTTALTRILDAILTVDGPAERLLLETSERARRRGASYLLGLCADEIAVRHIGAVILDEAPFLSTSAVAHVTQLVDHCQLRHGHALGLLLIGTTTDYQGLVNSGELGQRVTTVFRVPPLGEEEVNVFIDSLSPDLRRALRKAGSRARDDAFHALIVAADGSCRRLVRIIERAQHSARRAGRPLELRDLLNAIAAQAE